MPGNRNAHVIPQAQEALRKFKYEIAGELGLMDEIRNKGWANMTSHDCGRVGGQMVRRMIQEAERTLVDRG